MRNNNRLIRYSAVAATMLAAASTVDAQTCIGLPRTSVAPVNLSATLGMPKNATQLGARLGFGGTNAFGGVSFVHTDIDGAPKGATSFGGDIGYSVPVNAARTTHICPMLGVQYRGGQDTDTFDVSSTNIFAGAALGGEVDVSPNFTLVPHASAGVLHLRDNVENKNNGNDESFSETGGQLGVGLSLRFNRIFSITPAVAFPVGFDGPTDPTFSIGMSLGFRGR